jgi:uncharacterized protein YndB with AHSA1/START domain
MSAESARSPIALVPVSLDTADGRRTVILTRSFEFPARRVWAMITDPRKLRLWAPHTADRDLSTVGKVTFTMLGDVVDSPDAAPDIDVPGAILVADPPVVLEHTWVDDALVWEIAPDGDRSVLTLRHTVSDPSMASAVAAGWHLCLDVAESALAGRETAPVRGRAAMSHGWSELNERYAAELGVEPTSMDL